MGQIVRVFACWVNGTKIEVPETAHEARCPVCGAITRHLIFHGEKDEEDAEDESQRTDR